MKEFLNKWSNWWILNPKRKQLDDAFEKELNELIETVITIYVLLMGVLETTLFILNNKIESFSCAFAFYLIAFIMYQLKKEF